jgi:hypothetical protein
VHLPTGKVRLLALVVASAIALPANAPTWPSFEEATAPSPSARAHDSLTGRPALHGAPRHASWHSTGTAYADPSDEPDEGSDGWLPSADCAHVAHAAPFRLIADALSLDAVDTPRLPPTDGTPFRLRC